MVHLYGHKWSSIYGESATYDGKITDAAITWGSGLSGLTGQQIADGLKACIDRGDVWPPALPEFKQLCGGKTDKLNGFGLDYVPQCYRETRPGLLLESDPDKEKRKESAEKGISQIREVLGGRQRAD